MILTDVTIPSLGNTDNYEVDERVQVGEIIEEILTLAAQRSQSAVPSAKDFLLSEPSTGRIFDPAVTLAEYGVENGARLLLL